VLLHIVEAEYVADYKIRLRFDDGAEGEVDLASELSGPVFQPLRNLQTFRQFRLHPGLRTLVWPNGADFAPEFLRDKLTIAA
jgi:Protein of unknown function (DUF2442)